MNKTCEKCGKEFACHHNQDCWCVGYKVSKELSEYFRNKFNDCLCEECLKWYIDNEKSVLNQTKCQ